MDTNTIPLTREARLKALEEKQKEERKNFEKFEPYIETFLGNKLCRSTATQVTFNQTHNIFTLSFTSVDLETVIEHVCGPVHRAYNVDWKLEVHPRYFLLSAILRSPIYLHFFINIWEEEMASCQIVKTAVREKTKVEKEADIKKACETSIFEYRINCSE